MFTVNTNPNKSWDEIFGNPKEITFETLNTGYIIATKKGLFNANSPNYSTLDFESAKIPVLCHLISYKGKYHLIDTGFDSSFCKRWGGSFKGILRHLYFKNSYLQPDESMGIENQLNSKNINLESIFLTHAHEHCIGLSALNENIPLILGKGESDINFFPLVYSKNIKLRKNIQYLDFDKDSINIPYLGRCIDLFGDSSFWAIDTHGHTKGHISFLVNGINQKTLFVGDVCSCELGFTKNIESGTYSENIEESTETFIRLKNFSDLYPKVQVIFGHEVSGKFEIEYK